MYVHRSASSVVVRAPAKLNLFFEVLARRTDGYHEIETLMVPVTLFDTLVARNESDGRLRLACNWDEPAGDGARSGQSNISPGQMPPVEENLAYRAVQILRQRAGISAGITLELRKRIPVESGLGGGSSDAAAALLAANLIWNLDFSRPQLTEIAALLGSDVPFFLGRGPAVCRGRGERMEAEPGLTPLHFVLIRPPAGLATAAVYRACQVPERPRPLKPLLDALHAGDMRRLKSKLFNRLEPAAMSLCPWIERVRQELDQQNCVAHQMSGSGTSYFGVCHHSGHARGIARRLQGRGIGRVYAISTCN